MPTTYTIIIVLVVLALFLFPAGFFTIETKYVGLIERFRRYVRAARPGLNLRIPFVERVVARIYLGVQQLDVRVDSKTKDNVFAVVAVAVQYQVIEEKASESYYLLEDAVTQITSFVQDIIRTALAKLNLDDAYESKDQIANTVEAALATQMSGYGYRIVNTLITDIAPDPKVRAAMNDINAAQRTRVAAVELGEADKIKIVKAAEAAAEARRLAGEGFANERRAIVHGLTDQLGNLQEAGVNPNSAEVLLLMSQYFDTLSTLGTGTNSKVLFVPSDPQGLTHFGQQMQQAIISGLEVGNILSPPPPQPKTK